MLGNMKMKRHMNALTIRTLELILLPPSNMILFLLLALLFYKSRNWMLAIMFIGVMQLTLLSLPAIAEKLMNGLIRQNPPSAELWLKHPLPDAIVVLGAGRNQEAEEYGGSMSASTEMERLHYAAYLHRKTGIPILISGGNAGHKPKSEAEYMRDVMQEEFGVPVRWVETASHTTWENAAFTDRILSADGVKSAWVVTQSWHMPRALLAFKDKQVQYLPASVTFASSNYWQHQWMRWIPQSTALNRSNIALHEWFGLPWYKWRTKGSG